MKSLKKQGIINLLIGKLKELPDIRYEKVDKIKREIQSGTYNVSGKEIVDKMYENIEFDKRI